MDDSIRRRFSSRVKYSLPDRCWLWQGPPITRGGYGQMNCGGRVLRTHRIAYELWIGPIADGLFVCHRCDVPLCVNPSHLFLGTHADNMRDMSIKGRSGKGNRKGMRNNYSKLTDEQVIEIRRLWAIEKPTYTELGRRFDMHRSTIRDIVQRNYWKHI